MAFGMFTYFMLSGKFPDGILCLIYTFQEHQEIVVDLVEEEDAGELVVDVEEEEVEEAAVVR
jgi:hypothetical protein